MFVASTPLDPRKKRRTQAYDFRTPGISPIRREGKLEDKPYRLPKLPPGTSLEALRRPPSMKRPIAESLPGPPSKKQPLLENLNMGNVPISAIEVETRKSLAYLNGIISLPKRYTVDVRTQRSSQAVVDGINSHLMNVDQASKKNTSHFPELVVISDEEEESGHSMHRRTRRFVSSGNAGTLVAYNRYTSEEYYSTIIKSEPQDSKTIRSSRSRTSALFRNEKLPCVVENGTQRGSGKDTDEFKCGQPHREPEIAKFSIVEVDSWRELKDQPGVFFSKAPAPQSSGSDGEAFPARAGYLKMEAKKILDIQTCVNNVVFTVVKGKGRIKNKTEMKSSNAKIEMIVGDILTIPQGSTFNFTNLGTKNDLIMSYVKLA